MLSRRAWISISGYLETSDDLVTKLAIQLSFYGSLNQDVLLSLTTEDFLSEDGWLVLVAREKTGPRMIYLAPPVIETIREMEKRGLLPPVIGREEVSKQKVIGYSGTTLRLKLTEILKKAIHWSGEKKTEDDLKGLVPSSFRRAWVMDKNSALVWMLIGERRGRSSYTGAYFPERRRLSYDEVSTAYQSLGL